MVVQGAIDKVYTPLCLKGIRKYLPDSQIILSTWEGTNIKGLDYDKVVFNTDPKATVCSNDGTVNNVNREIISTKNGIKESNRKFVLKIRSDLILQSNNITKLNISQYKRNKKYSCFSERIIVCSIYSRYFAVNNKNRVTPILFHPSDWIYFGTKTDIGDLFNISLTNEPEFSTWFKDKKSERNGYVDSHPNRWWKFSPEAYILTQYLRERQNIYVADKLDITPELIKLSEHILVNNFYMADQIQIGLFMPKYKIKQSLMPKIDREGLYTNYHWQKEYKKHVDNNINVHLTYSEIMNKVVDVLNIKRRRR